MENTNIEQEIKQAAEDPTRIYLPNDPEQLEKYIDVAITMKMRTDNLNKEKQRPLKEIAILYKRFAFYTENHVIPFFNKWSYINGNASRKVDFLKLQLASASKSCSEVINQLKKEGELKVIHPAKGGTQSQQSLSDNHLQILRSYSGQPQSQSHQTSASFYPSFDTPIPIGGFQQPLSQSYNPTTSAAQNSQPYSNSAPLYGSIAGYNSTSSSLYPDIHAPTTTQVYYMPIIQTYNHTQPIQQQTVYNQYQTSYQQSYSQQPQPSYSVQIPLNNQQPKVYAPTTTDPFFQQPKQQQVAQQWQNLTDLKPVICPHEIIASFIRCANTNTKGKVETCAILAGTERDNTFIINTLIIPKQQGEKDRCQMTDDIGLFEVQIDLQLITIGWIHTHPQYSLFLSSVDLHNQLGYQMQLPEAIAIVYSPIESQMYKTFRIKDSRVAEIQNCTSKGFHEHLNGNKEEAFEECKHVVYISGKDNSIEVKTIDLR